MIISFLNVPLDGLKICEIWKSYVILSHSIRYGM